ncbi:MAG: type II toxin-antitoxin system VapB family antitoxin [Curtobacterium sp.]
MPADPRLQAYTSACIIVVWTTGGIMTVTTIDLDQAVLDMAKQLTGARTNRDVVNRALQTLIAVRQQPAAVERIIGRDFPDDQTAGVVVHYVAPGHPSDEA